MRNKNKGGRPKKHKEDYNEIAYKLCKFDGYTDAQLAEFFEVSEQTINNWKEKFPKFLESLKKGKEEYDDERVSNALRRRALGFKRAVEKPTKLGVVEVYEEVPPDTAACIFWLKNRQPRKWRDKQEHELSGNVKFKPVLAIAEDDPE